MAKQPLYLTRPGELKRKNNTLRFETEDGHRYIPIESVESIFVLNGLTLNTGLLEFLSYKHVPVHFYNYHGRYTGTFYPPEKYVSGTLLVKQVEHYQCQERRLKISKELLRGALSNILKNSRMVARKYTDIEGVRNISEELSASRKQIFQAATTADLMGIEGSLRKKYYHQLDLVHRERRPDFVMDTRVKRPPNNKMNTLISFVNSLVYNSTLNEIYKTQLNPDISFLHEPRERRHSLSLDLSEVFKPFIADRLIFRLINLQMLKQTDFDEAGGICYLNEKGRRKVIEEYHQKLLTKVMHRQLKRKVTYQRLMLLECYKLIKHIFDEQRYVSFKMWW